jgi:rod shape-determining protein MreC
MLEPWIALALAVILSLVLMATSNTQGTETARNRTMELVEAFARPFNIIPNILHLQAENTRLRAENTRLKLETLQQQEALRENQRLRRLLDFKERTPLQLRSAEVVGKNPLPGVRSLLINAGSNSGVRKHDAVVNDQGLVGKVVRVSANNAVVQLLTDRNLGAAVRLSNCRADGVTFSVGGQRLMLEGIPSSVPVRLGEAAISSGLDGVFPEGIPVGLVIRTERKPENLFLEVEIEPAVDFNAVEEVFVVQEDTELFHP